jgi:hypothetical protein
VVNRRAWFALVLLLSLVDCAYADDPWVRTGPEGRPEVQLYFFWALTCPHCTAAHPHVHAIPQTRPWVRLHALELTRQPENMEVYQALARRVGGEAASVPAFLFCGEMLIGWDGDETTGAYLRQRLDACHARILAAGAWTTASPPAETPAAIRLPGLGEVDPASLSLPVLTLVLAGLDAFNLKTAVGRARWCV